MGKRSQRRSASETPRKESTGKDEVGETPKDFIALLSRMPIYPSRQLLYEGVMSNSRIQMDTFLEKREPDSGRLPIPVLDKKRVKFSTRIAGDKDYYNATYMSLNNEDYVLAQGPNSDNVGDFWRMISMDGCQLIVCTVDEAAFGDANRSQCFNFFPREENKSQVYLNGRFTINCTKKQDMKGFHMYDLLLSSTDPVVKTEEGEAATNSQRSDGLDDRNTVITLVHIPEWKMDQWPDLEVLCSALYTIHTKEEDIIKNVKDEYVPPVVCVGLNGTQRSCAMWVWIMLWKQCEHRECFDVDNLIRHLVRVRPGALTDKLIFFVLYAMAFRIAAQTGWITEEDGLLRASEIQEGYKTLPK